MREREREREREKRRERKTEREETPKWTLRKTHTHTHIRLNRLQGHKGVPLQANMPCAALLCGCEVRTREC